MDHRFETLLRRYKDQIASPMERNDLFELIQSDEYDEALLEDIDNTLNSTTPGLFFTADSYKEETFLRIRTACGLDKTERSLGSPRANDPPTDGVGGRWLDIAASLILIATTSFWLLYNLQRNPDEKYYAGKGIYILPDGTEVTLVDNDSQLIYFTEHNSRIVKLSGEASFMIEWDATRPFFIQTGNLRTRVLGTSFNVRASLAPREARIVPFGDRVTDPSKSNNNPQTIL